jgi:hypothetical protein
MADAQVAASLQQQHKLSNLGPFFDHEPSKVTSQLKRAKDHHSIGPVASPDCFISVG